MDRSSFPPATSADSPTRCANACFPKHASARTRSRRRTDRCVVHRREHPATHWSWNGSSRARRSLQGSRRGSRDRAQISTPSSIRTHRSRRGARTRRRPPRGSHRHDRFQSGKRSLLTEPRPFNLMLQTYFGATGDEIAYLRPETAQAIFAQFKNVLDSSRVKVPFGIARSAKRSATKSTRAISPSARASSSKWKSSISATRRRPALDGRVAGRAARVLRGDRHPAREAPHLDIPDGERAFYSKKTYDIEYEFPFGIQELEGVAYRTDYDLGAAQKGARQVAGLFRRGDEGKIPPARRRAVTPVSTGPSSR